VRRLSEPSLGADCGACATWDDGLRLLRGCVAGTPSPDPIYGSTCHVCWGYPLPSGRLCDRCQGAGSLLHHRCPGPASRGLEEFSNAWGDFREHHLLPHDGPMSSQTHWFVQMARAADSELGAVEHEQRERAKREAERNKARRK